MIDATQIKNWSQDTKIKVADALNILTEALKEPIDYSVTSDNTRVETFGSGEGGWITKPYTNIKVTHLPTGISVTSYSERSQHANKSKALEELNKAIMAAERLTKGLNPISSSIMVDDDMHYGKRYCLMAVFATEVEAREALKRITQ